MWKSVVVLEDHDDHYKVQIISDERHATVDEIKESLIRVWMGF
jgi:hypothetical protein